jgi:hypothetical protein
MNEANEGCFALFRDECKFLRIKRFEEIMKNVFLWKYKIDSNQIELF